MAKLHEEMVIIKVSKLLRDDESSEQTEIINSDFINNLEKVTQELAGHNCLIEVQPITMD